jgi:serine/threonine protein kinase
MDPALRSADRGTLPYVAPELARGEVEPDQSSDVFALAATMAFVALGRPPCMAETPAALLVEISERGLDLDALSSVERLAATERRALCAALGFEPAGRVRRAREVRRLLGA